MTKQEIDNLKVGDVLMGNNDWKIEEILESKKFGKLFIFIEGRDVWTEYDVMGSFLRVKQQPKKIPYTLETFPENALLIKDRFGDIYFIIEKTNTYIRNIYDEFYFYNNFETQNIEIGIIEDGKIEIEWKPFYLIEN